MSDSGTHDLRTLVGSLVGMPCWYVSSGGAAGSTFQLALGDKVPRETPIRNAAHTDEYRRFSGEANLLVWCAWRLDKPTGPLVSWDDDDANVSKHLTSLVGARIHAVSLLAPAWDLELAFDNHLTLKIFSDHVGPDPSFDGNWELWTPALAAFVGPGATVNFEAKADRPVGAG